MRLFTEVLEKSEVPKQNHQNRDIPSPKQTPKNLMVGTLSYLIVYGDGTRVPPFDSFFFFVILFQKERRTSKSMAHLSKKAGEKVTKQEFWNAAGVEGKLDVVKKFVSLFLFLLLLPVFFF